MMKQSKDLRNICVHSPNEMSKLHGLTQMSFISIYEKHAKRLDSGPYELRVKRIIRILIDGMHFRCLAPVVLSVIVSVAVEKQFRFLFLRKSLKSADKRFFANSC